MAPVAAKQPSVRSVPQHGPPRGVCVLTFSFPASLPIVGVDGPSGPAPSGLDTIVSSAQSRRWSS